MTELIVTLQIEEAHAPIMAVLLFGCGEIFPVGSNTSQAQNSICTYEVIDLQVY
jgi:hypothetical protein